MLFRGAQYCQSALPVRFYLPRKRPEELGGEGRQFSLSFSGKFAFRTIAQSIVLGRRRALIMICFVVSVLLAMAPQATQQCRVRHLPAEENAEEQTEARPGRLRNGNAAKSKEEPGQQVGLHNNAGRGTGNATLTLGLTKLLSAAIKGTGRIARVGGTLIYPFDMSRGIREEGCLLCSCNFKGRDFGMKLPAHTSYTWIKSPSNQFPNTAANFLLAPTKKVKSHFLGIPLAKPKSAGIIGT